MEKAILKTLIYSDIFDYPLKVWEIHKWLIGRKVTLFQIEKAVEKLRVKGKAERVKAYYVLPRRKDLILKRKRREKQSEKYLRKAKILTFMLKLVPWIKLVGISGGLVMGNASKGDDIDLFVITSKNRLWISRLFVLGLLSLTGQRRKVGQKGRQIAGKLCVNTLLEEDRLEQSNKDIYLAHEILQMKVLWERDGIYGKYLEDNNWVFKFIPNWTTSVRGPVTLSLRGASHRATWQSLLIKIPTIAFGDLGMTMENLAKWIQLKIMEKPKGMERIEDGALYFHPDDIRPKILKIYRQKTGTP